MPLPSMTFCHKGLQKYGSIERLANFIDPEKDIPKEVFAVRNEFLKIQFQKIKNDLEGTNFCDWLFGLEGDEREDNSTVMDNDYLTSLLVKLLANLLNNHCP